eukprot:gene1044-1575_t
MALQCTSQRLSLFTVHITGACLQVLCFSRAWYMLAATAIAVTVTYFLGTPFMFACLPRVFKMYQQVKAVRTGDLFYIHEQRLLRDVERESATSGTTSLREDVSLPEDAVMTINPFALSNCDAPENGTHSPVGSFYMDERCGTGSPRRKAAGFYMIEQQRGVRVDLQPQFGVCVKAGAEGRGTQPLTLMDNPQVLRVFGSFLQPYKNELPWWFGVEMVRRFVQTSLVVIVDLIDSKYNLLYTNVVVACFLGLHCSWRPYKDTLAGHVQTVCLVIQCVSACAFLHCKTFSGTSNSIGTGLIAIQSVLCGLTISIIVRGFYLDYKSK